MFSELLLRFNGRRNEEEMRHELKIYNIILSKSKPSYRRLKVLKQLPGCMNLNNRTNIVCLC